MSERILFIAHRTPYPPNKGDKIRSYNILRHLSERHDVDLFFMIDDPRDFKYVDELRKFTATCCFDVIKPRLKKMLSVFSLVTSKPLSVPYFYSRKLQKKIDENIEKKDFAHVFCFSSPTAEYIFRSRFYQTKLQKASLLMDLIDVDSLKWRQYAESTSWPMRTVYQREARQLLAYEKRIADEFDELLLVSEAEKRIFQQHVKTGNVFAISNGVDLEKFAPGKGMLLTKTAPLIVFTGAMDYRPNIDGVVWFVNEILPLVRNSIVDAQFVIVGSNPAPQVKALAQCQGVDVTGFVEDVRDYIATADLCVVPLKVARGVQNKVLEAMAMGKAVVCTPEALEGISAEPGKDIATAQNAHDFSQEIIWMLSNGQRRKFLGQNARECMEKHYSWDINLQLLDALLEGAE